MSHLEHFLWLVSQIFPPDLTLSLIPNPCKIGRKMTCKKVIFVIKELFIVPRFVLHVKTLMDAFTYI